MKKWQKLSFLNKKRPKNGQILDNNWIKKLTKKDKFWTKINFQLIQKTTLKWKFLHIYTKVPFLKFF